MDRDIDWSDWRYVQAALTHGTFTRAAEALGVGQATVSRRVAVVEAALGHVLFDRHRTGLVPTSAARHLIPHLEAISSAALDAERALDGLERLPRGEVRVAGPPGLCVDWMPGLAARLARSHPDLRLCVLADISSRDLNRREADIALRMVPTDQGDLLVRRLASFPGGLFATPGYVAALPDPPSAADVGIVQYDDEHNNIALAKFLESLGTTVAFRSNSYLVQRAAVLAGVGAGLFGVREARELGLVPVPLALPVPVEAPLFLVVHRALRHVPRVAVVIEAIEALVAEAQGSATGASGSSR